MPTLPPDDPRRDLFPYFRTVDELPPGVIDWSTVFERPSQPVELDIGCGRGLFVYSASLAAPETNFLGIELDYTEARRGARRLQKRNAINARVLGGDVLVFLAKHVAPGSIDAAHVYFPDPWWKRKHLRRRLFTDSFADQLAVIVARGGWVHSWTDVEDYFHVIQGLMNHHPLFEAHEPPAEKSPEHDMDYQTSFERRKRMDGLPIYRGRWRRR